MYAFKNDIYAVEFKKIVLKAKKLARAIQTTRRLFENTGTTALLTESDVLRSVLYEEMISQGESLQDHRDVTTVSRLVDRVVASTAARLNGFAKGTTIAGRLEARCQIAAGALPHFRHLSFCDTCALISL